MSARKVLVYGGRGALGSTCVSKFKELNWWVGSIDLAPNDMADANITVSKDAGWVEQEKEILSELEKLLKNDKLDAVICVAGGWAGGNASKELAKNADLMWRQSVWSSTISATISSHWLKPGGVLTLTGADAALNGTPGMIGYGLAKAAVHQLTKSLAEDKSGLPADSLVVSILPITLDTPMNRKWMPKADTSEWTPLDFIAETFAKWTEGENRPKNGSLIRLVTKENKTELIAA